MKMVGRGGRQKSEIVVVSEERGIAFSKDDFHMGDREEGARVDLHRA